jgi:hypothetical protein
MTIGDGALSGQGTRRYEENHMKTIWMLVAAASLAACAGRGEDDMGAAPERDTTVTTGADTTAIDTTGVGETAEPGMVPDTTTGDVQQDPTLPADTTMQDPGMTPPTDTTLPADTTMQDPGMTPPADTTLPADTSSTGGYVDPSAPPSDDTSGTYGTPEDTSGTVGQDSAWADPAAPSADTTQSQ